MKRTPIKSIGKIGKRNINANRILKKLYAEAGITSCELKFDGCCGNSFLSFAHKEKRERYRSCPEKLADINETLLACIPCHERIEKDRELTIEVFNKLRPI